MKIRVKGCGEISQVVGFAGHNISEIILQLVGNGRFSVICKVAGNSGKWQEK